jgi:ribosomal protein S18 acetylase RimI-like enzyme
VDRCPDRLVESLIVDGVAITPGGSDDIPALRELWLELHHHHQQVGPQSGIFQDDETSWQVRSSEYREWLGDGRSFLLLARAGERLIGYCVVRVMEAEPDLRDAWKVPDVVAEVETMIVSGDYRGAGVGGRLLDAADAKLDELGITEVLVGLIPGNDGAERLYRRRGFQPRWLLLARGAHT